VKAREKQIINTALLTDPLCMNLREGGDGGWDHVTRLREHQSRAGKLGGKSASQRKMKSISATGQKYGPLNMTRYNATASPAQRTAQALKGGATQKARGTTLKGRLYLHRGDEQVLVREREINGLLAEGFIKGKRPRRK
jgi:hypothetical protein